MHDNPAITLTQISKIYRIYARPEDRLKQMLLRGLKTYFSEFHALHDISLSIPPGQTIGLIGRNGSGKSTLLQIVCGTLQPSGGECAISGRISALLELGAGFNPEFSGRENIFLNAAILGLSRAETEARYADIVAFSGLDAMHVQQPVKTYSSGMYVRLAFAVAVAVEPDILVVDEALAVGDEGFQRKCFARIRELQARGSTVLLVSHAPQAIIDLCDRALLMDRGEIIADGEPKQVIADYHKLVYAPAERRTFIHNDIKQGVNADEEAVSESRIEYAAAGGRIGAIRLTDKSGEPVDVLHTGGRYQLHYDVRYDAPATAPCYGMMLKTKRGVDLGGAVARELAQRGESVAAGEVAQVCFTFDCPLRPGHYFLNCGTTRREGDADVFVHRIVDALQFKVIDPREHGALEPAGVLDLGMVSAITRE